MSIKGWYYLHSSSKDLIYKPEHGETHADIRESDFALMMWPIDPADRAGAWRILVEGLCLGAKKERVAELSKKWGCDDKDAEVYAERIGLNLTVDGSSFCAARQDFVNLQESPAGFGDTALEAMAELCKELGYKPAKMWSTAFDDLVSRPFEDQAKQSLN